MCSRYSDDLPPDALRALFHALRRGGQTTGEGVPPGRGLVAPTDLARVVRRHPVSGELHVDALRWGLVPAWAPGLAVGVRAFNARLETLAVKPTFREAYARRRALIPAGAYYEWAPDGAGQRRPHRVTAADGGPLVFAGLWEGWRAPTGGGMAGAAASDMPAVPGAWVRTFTIITTAANDALAPLHDRMPLILAPTAWEAWLAAGEVPAMAGADVAVRVAPSDPLPSRRPDRAPAVPRQLAFGTEACGGARAQAPTGPPRLMSDHPAPRGRIGPLPL